MKHYFFVILNLTAPVLMHFHYIEKSGKVWLDKPNTFFFYIFTLFVCFISYCYINGNTIYQICCYIRIKDFIHGKTLVFVYLFLFFYHYI